MAMTTDFDDQDPRNWSDNRVRVIERQRIREAQQNARDAWAAMHAPPVAPDPRIAVRQQLDDARRAILIANPGIKPADLDQAAQRYLSIATQADVDAQMDQMVAEQNAFDDAKRAESDAMLARVAADAPAHEAARAASRAAADAEFDAGVRGRQLIDSRWATEQGNG